MGIPLRHGAPLKSRVLQGAGLALLLTLFRVAAGFAAGRLPLWVLVILFGSVAIGGGVGGAAYYASDSWRNSGGWRKTTANVGALLAYTGATVASMGIAAYFIPALR